MQYDSIQSVYDAAISNGGGTFAIETHHDKRFVTDAGFRDGFYVATEGNEHIVEREAFDKYSIQWFIAKHLPLLTNTREGYDYFLGIWENNGYWYLDISEYVGNFTKAVNTAIDRRQLAIWDIAAGEDYIF